MQLGVSFTRWEEQGPSICVSQDAKVFCLPFMAVMKVLAFSIAYCGLWEHGSRCFGYNKILHPAASASGLATTASFEVAARKLTFPNSSFMSSKAFSPSPS